MLAPGYATNLRDARWNLYAGAHDLARTFPTAARFLAATLLAGLTALAAQAEVHTPLTPVPFTLQVLPVLASGALLGARWGAASQALYVGAGLVGAPVFAGGASGLGVVAHGAAGGYLLGFVLAAYLVGRFREARSERRRPLLLLAGGATVFVAASWAILHAYLLDSSATFATPAWATLLLVEAAVLLAILAAAARQTRRRERIELLAALTLGLLAIYAAGAVGVAATLPASENLPAVGEALALAVVPFVPWDLFKIALVLGAFAALRPTQAEASSRTADGRLHV